MVAYGVQRWRQLAFPLLAALALSSCANSPFGQTLERSFAADPRLTDSAAPKPTPTASPDSAASPAPTASPSSTPPKPDGGHLAEVPRFSGSLNLGLSGSSVPPPAVTGPTTFSDLDATPDPIREYVADVAQLGLLTPAKPDAATQFAPNAPVTRRDYARWLVAVNNRLYYNQPAQQIRLAVESSTPAFKDVPKDDPDFAAIQGLAEAGLIPSLLSGDSEAANFRPDATLDRETLLRWKVPIDLRQPLPPATLATIKDTWGFKDAAKIDPAAFQVLLADYQNGADANIRRAFGYITLLQPGKAVTRAEAAATLWQIGYQGMGRTARLFVPVPQASPS